MRQSLTTKWILGAFIMAAAFSSGASPAAGEGGAATKAAVPMSKDVAKAETLEIWPGEAPIGDGKTEKANVTITVYHPVKPNGAAVVICPGGGYGGLVTGPEGHGIAQWLSQHGITGVVLPYRLPNKRPFVPLLDAQQTMRVVRSKAAEWGIDAKRVGVCGFSAGGHLASTLATHFDSGKADAKDPVEKLSCRPDFAILIYPVIVMGEKTHQGTKNNLLGPTPAPELVTLFSNEKQVTAQTPPTFLAHAKDDTVVPPINSQVFYEALRAHKVAGEYLVLPSGGHGLNGYKGPSWDAWQAKSLQWLVEQKFIPAK